MRNAHAIGVPSSNLTTVLGMLRRVSLKGVAVHARRVSGIKFLWWPDKSSVDEGEGGYRGMGRRVGGK